VIVEAGRTVEVEDAGGAKRCAARADPVPVEETLSLVSSARTMAKASSKVYADGE
jgi:hypothetical protein